MTYEPAYEPTVGAAVVRREQPVAVRTRAAAAAGLMMLWVGLLWLLETIDQATHHALDTFGIVPREPGELRDIIPAAFIHFGYDHVAANSLPLFALGFLAALRGIRRFLKIAFVVILVSGFGVWLTAAPHTNTAGASGVVFGLFGYLLVRGFVDRRLVDIGVGVLVAAAYGSILWGVLPSAHGVSWQGHLFGLIGGVACAFFFRERANAL